MEENCIGSQSPQRTVVPEKKKKNMSTDTFIRTKCKHTLFRVANVSY
jgi:hypothetical protein